MQQQNRHLAAILFTDIVGYTAMMQKDEQVAVAVVRWHNYVMQNTVAAHNGENMVWAQDHNRELTKVFDLQTGVA